MFGKIFFVFFFRHSLCFSYTHSLSFSSSPHHSLRISTSRARVTIAPTAPRANDSIFCIFILCTGFFLRPIKTKEPRSNTIYTIVITVLYAEERRGFANIIKKKKPSKMSSVTACGRRRYTRVACARRPEQRPYLLVHTRVPKLHMHERLVMSEQIKYTHTCIYISIIRIYYNVYSFTYLRV